MGLPAAKEEVGWSRFQPAFEHGMSHETPFNDFLLYLFYRALTMDAHFLNSLGSPGERAHSDRWLSRPGILPYT